MRNLDFLFKKSRLRLLIASCLFLIQCLWVTSPALADGSEGKQLTVSGTVKDAKDGAPIPGVSILVQGTTKGTISDLDGKYTISVPNADAVLVFSFIGYNKETANVGGKSVVDVMLKANDNDLQEVVVVGYGERKKESLTAAISTMSSRDLQGKGVVSNPASALQGQVAGVVVTRSSSAPGREGWDFKIRGQASINNPEVLVLIDNIPASLNDINPDDIESMSFLKDAAAAIYGSRAAGGVVLVTTKRGKVQKPKISYKTNLAIKKPSMQQEFMNMQQWAYSIEEAWLNDGNAAGADIGAMPYWALQAMKTKDSRYYNTVQNYNVGANAGTIHNIGFMDYSMNDETWGTAISNSHSLSIQGGSEKNQYNISIGYMKDNSPLKAKWGDDNSTRYNIRINNDLKVTKWFDLSTDFSFDRRENKYPTSSPTAITGNPPGSPLLTPGGNPFGWASNYTPVVAALFGGTTTTNVNSTKLSLSPKFHIIDGLDLISSVYFNPWDTNNMKYQNVVTWYDYSDVPYTYNNPATSFVNRDAKTVMKQQYQAYLNYKKDFGLNHHFNAMLGSSYENERATKFTLQKSALGVQDLHSVNTASTYTTGTDEITTWAIGSYFARLNYDFQGKYLFELNGRYDGSSKFAWGKKWCPFYGGSLGWRISEEKFMKSNGIFDNLKVRASYGQIGNQAEIGYYDYVALLEYKNSESITDNYPIFGSDASPAFGQTITQKNVLSKDRTWEVIKTSNLGLDFSVLKDRLSGTVEYFVKKNDNMLVNLTYPSVLGATAPKTNDGSMEVRGWEASMTWRDKVAGVEYYITANISDAKNKILSMQNATTRTWNAKTNYLVGYAMNSYWGLEANKLIENADELAAYKAKVGSDLISSNLLRVGDMMYNDLDGDGKITKADVKYLGDNTAHYSFGLTMGANYKNFDFSASIQGVGKQLIMRNANAATMLVANTYQNQGAVWYGKNWSDISEKYPSTTVTYLENDKSSTTTALLLASVNKDPNAVPKTTTNGTIRTYDYLYSDAWYRAQNGAYARLKNITLGYTLPKPLLSKVGIEKLRVYFSGNDLFEITKTKDGWDPEATAEDPFGGTNGSNGYPFMRSYSFGIDLTF